VRAWLADPAAYPLPDPSPTPSTIDQ